MWSGRSHHRYVKFEGLTPIEGIGASLLRVAWALDRAISFDLEPIFVGPFLASHDTGDFGEFMGLTNNPWMAIRDPLAYANATHQRVPFPDGDGDSCREENRTSVVYEVDAMHVHKLIQPWGRPVEKPNRDSRVCRYVRHSLRQIYWSAPREHGRCYAFLPASHVLRPEGEKGRATGYGHDQKRPWVLAVHIRRGDFLTYWQGARCLPQKFFSAAVRSVLLGIAAVDPAAHVSILVFSEGPRNMTGLQLPDENGEAITWDIQHESCLDVGLNCSQV